VSPSPKNPHKSEGRIRIIGGKWRGRQIKVLTHQGLRPTPDRVRETLFNWLAMHIVGAKCLDLFAGTGALGFEALSRGAKQVIFVDKYPPIIESIANTAKLLQATESCEFHRASAISFLEPIKDNNPPFDIIFLDPPFGTPLLSQSIAALAGSTLVNDRTLLYIESPLPLTESDLPEHWEIIRAKTAGEVAYHLVRGATI
jgi:16S rRNA (guanine966-N2)-methyltransferase